jgi:hypothetical protein
MPKKETLGTEMIKICMWIPDDQLRLSSQNSETLMKVFCSAHLLVLYNKCILMNRLIFEKPPINFKHKFLLAFQIIVYSNYKISIIKHNKTIIGRL